MGLLCTGPGLRSETVTLPFPLWISDKFARDSPHVVVWEKNHVHKFFDTLPTGGDVSRLPAPPPGTSAGLGVWSGSFRKALSSLSVFYTSWGALSCTRRSLTALRLHVGGRRGWVRGTDQLRSQLTAGLSRRTRARRRFQPLAVPTTTSDTEEQSELCPPCPANPWPAGCAGVRTWRA